MIAFQTFVLFLGIMLAALGIHPGSASRTVPAGPSDLASACAEIGSGSLAFRFPVRDGVTGNDHGVRIRWGGDQHSWFRGWYEDSDRMQEGPAWIVLQLDRGAIVEVSVTVGPDGPRLPSDCADLGLLDPGPAAAFCLGMIPAVPVEVAENLLLGGVIARGAEVTDPLLAIARDRSLDPEVRGETVMWLAMLAGEKVAGQLADMAGDRREDLEVREHAVFALSQLPGDRGRKPLLEIARDRTEPRLQRVALHALTEFQDDPEVLVLLEDILTGD